jgi:hypothetical protein
MDMANNPQTGKDPLLDPEGLKNNICSATLCISGPTETIALCTGMGTPSMGCTDRSPAIDTGNNAVCAAAPVKNIDQRGFERPVGGTCDIGAFESGAAPPQVINSLVALADIPSTFNTTSDVTGCPTVFVGKSSFSATLTNQSSNSLYDLMARVTALTNGNLLQNADGGPGGVGALLTVPQIGEDYDDGLLGPREFVDVAFVICLKELSQFEFFVDVPGLVAQ